MGLWIRSRNKNGENTTNKEKSNVYSVFFRSTDLAKAIKLVWQKTVTANIYDITCLPEILQEIYFRMLHQDNASSHSAKTGVSKFFEQKTSMC